MIEFLGKGVSATRKANAGRYLSPEPLLQNPRFATAMAKRGLSTPAYPYAANNPITYVDPDGLRIRLAGGSGRSAGFGMRLTPQGRMLYDWLDQSPNEYTVRDATAPIEGLGESLGRYRPGSYSSNSCESRGGTIELYELLVRLSGRDPAQNLAHELTHAGLHEAEVMGSEFVPPSVHPFRGEAQNGALPPTAHNTMDAYWQVVFVGGL